MAVAFILGGTCIDNRAEHFRGWVVACGQRLNTPSWSAPEASVCSAQNCSSLGRPWLGLACPTGGLGDRVSGGVGAVRHGGQSYQTQLQEYFKMIYFS